MRDKFTLGKTQDEWIEELYKAGAAADPELPSWEGILEQGVYKRKLPTAIAFEENVKDPVGHPWNTPSGKIEIYSEALAKIAEDRELEGRLTEGQVISPIPIFDPGVEGYGAVTDEYPLYMSGWHDKARTHSSFGSLEVLKDYNRHRLWINPLDADPRGIHDGDKVRVKSPAGEVEIEAEPYRAERRCYATGLLARCRHEGQQARQGWLHQYAYHLCAFTLGSWQWPFQFHHR